MSPDEKTVLELEREQLETAADAENASRKGVGTRVKIGSTRGRSVQNIKYEAFDENQPDTLPKTVEEFVKITGISGNAALAELLVVGFNDKSYTDASDPIADYLNPAWPAETKAQFRLVVRNLAKMQDMSIGDAAMLVKPGTEKKFAASLVTA